MSPYPAMRRSFLTWLSLLFCAAFAVTGVLAYLQGVRYVERMATQVMETRLTDLMSLINHSTGMVKQVVEINDASTIARARALAEIIRLNPGVLKDQDALQGLCNDLGASEIYVTDGQGITVAAVPENNKGFDFNADEHARPFLKCIDTPGHELCCRPQTNGRESGLVQHAGVHRLDTPGVVRMTFRPQHEQSVRSAGSFGTLARDYKIGKGGHIIAFRGGEILNKNELSGSPSALLDLPVNQAIPITLNDTDYLAYAVSSEEYRLVGLMDYREINKLSVGGVRSLIRSNLALFALMFAVVAFLLQKIVVGGIQRINHSLGLIAKGQLDKEVEEHSYPEFITLSTGINHMVDSLRDYGAQERERMRRELELARDIQSAALPNKFPAFPNNPEFDLYATCTQAKVVGGDFYDFFMPSSEHVCFLVADVSAYGIPAALFMMRCMSIIRGLARSDTSPAELVAEANRSLCENNSLDMRVRLFYGSLDIRSGELTYVNAGPPQALLQHNGGDYEIMPSKSGEALGYLPDATYTECRTVLSEGDRIFLYTEGAVNATDSYNTPFGEARLQEALRTKAPAVSDVLRAVRSSLRQFIGMREPNKDITMLAFEYKGRMHASASLSVKAGKADGVAAALSEPLESVFAAPLCISDIVASVHSVLNALPDDCTVDISLRCNEEQADISLRYTFGHFNPLVCLPHLPVDHADYALDEGGESTLSLRKSLE